MRRVGGFTLIEVLIAVLVLSLGVLGLAAVFTVGIPQQRLATNQVAGIAAADTAVTAMLSNPRLNEPYLQQGGADTPQLRGWRAWQQDIQDWSPQGQWMLPNGTNSAMTLDPVTGDVVVEGFNATLDVRLPLSERLTPRAYTRGSEPRFVWDFVARRVRTGLDASGKPTVATVRDPIEIAVFVRAVDSGIAVPARPRKTKSQVPTYGPRLRLSDLVSRNAGEISLAEAVVPVAVPSRGGRGYVRDGVGLPTRNGRGDYGQAFTIAVAPNQSYGSGGGPGFVGGGDLERNRIPLRPGIGLDPQKSELEFRIASQIGQKLVDGLGNVYTVLEVDERAKEDDPGARIVIVDPPVPQSVQDSSELGSVLLMPQVPAAVRIVRVQP
ncbi:MAG: prepilin-type N-terminal cleavage/methylation domain-containing protein [Phycisphaeraceae bacterium]|nr:prepilin-type N-terminal cleavage/methylation domain-containing protein [Phycisphaeraceae bacterium]